MDTEQNTKYIVSGVLIALLFIGFVFLFLKFNKKDGNVSDSFLDDISFVANPNDINPVTNPNDISLVANPIIGYSSARTPSEDELAINYMLFKSDKYGFSLSAPKEFIPQVFDEQGGQTILFQGKEKGTGFQIFATPFDEEVEMITSAIINRYIPNLKVEEPQEAILGDNTRALIFWSNDSIIGKTREVWFIKNKYLFEVTSFAGYDDELAKILSTLKFD